MKKSKKIILAETRGFCEGVKRAIKIVEDTLAEEGAPVYVRHDIVHNDYVVESFRERGVVFVEDLSEVPAGRPVIFSAHGVSPDVEAKARSMGLKCIDATCPLVKKIHEKAVKLKEDGYTILLIGHKVHPEIVGTLGHLGGEGVVVEDEDDARSLDFPADTEKITYLTQTTLSPDDVSDIVKILEEKFPNLEEPSRHDICYATLERQKAVKELAEKCDVILVIGSVESSNSNRLKEVAEQYGVEAYLINSYKDIPEKVLKQSGNIGVTAGASAPEILVEEVVECLEHGA
jgi:4-hydroxy-3-methylbut-2-enyl diphosphate reductase